MYYNIDTTCTTAYCTSITLIPCIMKVSRHAGHDCHCCVSYYSGVIRIVQRHGVDSDNGLQFLVGQLVDCHDFG